MCVTSCHKQTIWTRRVSLFKFSLSVTWYIVKCQLQNFNVLPPFPFYCSPPMLAIQITISSPTILLLTILVSRPVKVHIIVMPVLLTRTFVARPVLPMTILVFCPSSDKSVNACPSSEDSFLTCPAHDDSFIACPSSNDSFLACLSIVKIPSLLVLLMTIPSLPVLLVTIPSLPVFL